MCAIDVAKVLCLWGSGTCKVLVLVCFAGMEGVSGPGTGRFIWRWRDTIVGAH